MHGVSNWLFVLSDLLILFCYAGPIVMVFAVSTDGEYRYVYFWIGIVLTVLSHFISAGVIK
jgi:hypothetical protein